MIERTPIATDKAPPAVGPYAQAIRAGDFAFVSGQLPIDPETGTMADTVAEQTRQSIANIRAILAADGIGLERVVKTTVFITDMDRFAEMNEVYAEAFGATPPARSAYQVVRLPKDALVEIEAFAVAGNGAAQ